MKNLISRNEGFAATWKWDEKNTETEKYDQVSEYFQCISECDIPDHDELNVSVGNILTTN